MTATQPDSDERTISRRGVMRATAIGVGAAGSGAIGTRYATGSVAAVDWGLVGSYALGGPIGALAYGAIFGSSDNAAVADSLSWENYVDEYTRTREDEIVFDNTLTSYERDIQLVENKAREAAIFSIYEQAVDSGTETDATNAAEAAIDEAYATVQRSILDTWTVRSERAISVAQTLEETNWDSSASGVSLLNYDDTGPGSYQTNGTIGQTVTLFDGTDYSYTTFDNSEGVNLTTVTESAYDYIKLYEPDPANFASVDEPLAVSYASTVLFDFRRLMDQWSQLSSKRQTVIDEVPNMVDSYFTPAQEGDLDLNSALGPDYLADTASNAADFEEAALAMRSLGYPVSDQALVFSFDEYPDETFDARLAWTAHNGDTLPVGETITPENTVGSIFAAANNTPEGEDQTGGTFEITEPFTILETDDGTTQVSFEDRSIAESGTTAEEVERIFRENYDANQKATETVYTTATSDGGGAGGGGGFLSGSDQNWGVIAVGAGLAAIGWGYITEDSS